MYERFKDMIFFTNKLKGKKNTLTNEDWVQSDFEIIAKKKNILLRDFTTSLVIFKLFFLKKVNSNKTRKPLTLLASRCVYS